MTDDAKRLIVGDLQTGEVYEEDAPPPVSPEEFMRMSTAKPAYQPTTPASTRALGAGRQP